MRRFDTPSRNRISEIGELEYCQQLKAKRFNHLSLIINHLYSSPVIGIERETASYKGGVSIYDKFTSEKRL
jgi:hypothetical protein